MKRTRKPKPKPVASLAEWKGLHRPGNPPKILSDQELREFLDEALTRMTFKEAAAACVERFGKDRAPSLSVIHRYWHASQKTQAKG